MAGAAENDSGAVAIVSRVAGGTIIAGTSWMSRLRHFLINDAIQILLGVEMIVAVEDNAHFILYQKLMYGRRPARTVLLETIRAVGIPAAPFEKRHGLNAATALVVQTPD